MSGVEGLLTASAFAGLATVAVFALDAWICASLRRRVPAPEGVILGTRVEPPQEPVALRLDELQQGMLIGGSPGAGKTTLLKTMISRLPSEVGVVIVDLKGDRSLGPALGIPASDTFGLGERVAAAWNPLASGTAASWRDILISAEEWSEPHYRRAAARYVGAVLAALASSREAVSLEEVIALLERPKATHGLLRELPERERAVLARAVAAIESEASLRSGVLGLGNRLALLVDSPATFGKFGASGGVELSQALRGGRLLFSLPAAEFPDEAPAIAATVIQSLGAEGQRLAAGDERLRTLLVVDEAPRLSGEQLREAVAIGRGAGIGSVVAVQDFADLDYVSPGTREAVETGANTWVVMRQVASAEQIADALGSRATLRETIQRDERRLFASDTGMRSVREVEQYRVSPNVIRELPRGEAVVWRRLRPSLDRIKVDASTISSV